MSLTVDGALVELEAALRRERQNWRHEVATVGLDLDQARKDFARGGAFVVSPAIMKAIDDRIAGLETENRSLRSEVERLKGGNEKMRKLLEPWPEQPMRFGVQPFDPSDYERPAKRTPAGQISTNAPQSEARAGFAVGVQLAGSQGPSGGSEK